MAIKLCHTVSKIVIAYLYQNLSSYTIRQSSFQKIEFCYQSQFIPQFDQMTSKLQDHFGNIGWIILVQHNGHDHTSIHFINMNDYIETNTNPNYRPTLLIETTRPTLPSQTEHAEEDWMQHELFDNYESSGTGQEMKVIFNDRFAAKDLQLRIVYQPLGYKKKKNCATCCLCCKDLVDPLSKEERVIKLTIGFIRIYSSKEISTDIYSLCMDFVGEAEGFSINQLMSNTELSKVRRDEFLEEYCKCDCQLCWLKVRWKWNSVVDFIWEFCCPWDFKDGCWCREFGECFWEWPEDTYCFSLLFKLIVILTFLFGKDIAGLIIIGTNDCNNTIDGDGESKYVSFDVFTWILVGCVVHLVNIVLIPVLYAILCGKDGEGSLFTVCGCMLMFCAGWMIIGFLMYSEMNDSNYACKSMVLSWSIIQAFETVLGPCCVFATLAAALYDDE